VSSADSIVLGAADGLPKHKKPHSAALPAVKSPERDAGALLPLAAPLLELVGLLRSRRPRSAARPTANGSQRAAGTLLPWAEPLLVLVGLLRTRLSQLYVPLLVVMMLVQRLVLPKSGADT
jgi:hypothetical protein